MEIFAMQGIWGKRSISKKNATRARWLLWPTNFTLSLAFSFPAPRQLSGNFYDPLHLAAHVKVFQAPGVISVCDTLLNCLPFKLGEYDTDIQHSPAHGGRGVKLFCGRNKLYIVFLKQLHHIRKVQNGAAYSVQFVDNYPANLALAYLAKELLKLGPVGILAGITLVFENPATAAFQLILAEINLALNADSTIQMTANIYTHLEAQDSLAAALKLNNYLDDLPAAEAT